MGWRGRVRIDNEASNPEEALSNTSSCPEVSVVVPSYRSTRTLGRCVEALLSQDHSNYEVIVVASGGDDEALRAFREHPRLRILSSKNRMFAAVARNRGAEEAMGELIAFTDADVIVPPDWLSTLVAASESRYCVGGSLANGTPESSAGTVEYWVEFLDLHPARPPRSAWHGATGNLLVPRALWEELGPFPTDMGGGEDTVVTVAARARGLFRFCGAAPATHLNRTTWREVLPHQYDIGLFTAHLGRRTPYKWRFLVRYTALAPLAVLGRIQSVYARIWAWDRESRYKSIVLFPAVVVALCVWGAGLFVQGARLDARSLTRDA